MIKLKKTYNRDMMAKDKEISKLLFKNKFTEMENNDLRTENLKLKDSLDTLDTTNKNLSEANMKIHIDHKKIQETSFKVNAKLANEVEDLKKQLMELQHNYSKIEKEKIDFEKLYKNHKTKLNANAEAKRQLEKLAYGEEKNVNKIKKYLKQLVTQIGI